MRKISQMVLLMNAACLWHGLPANMAECSKEQHDAASAAAMRVTDYDSALTELRCDMGTARRIVAAHFGRDYQHAVHVSAFGPGWRDKPQIAVFASGRAERAYRRAYRRAHGAT